jgi:beta-lactamase superfamily II metal-dependent hydrolase
MIDVGQGDGMVLVSPDGFVLMVDTGDEDHLADVRDYLAAAGVPALDHVLVSHFHADHMGAMAGLLRAHPEVGYAFDSGGRYDSDQYEQYVRAAGDKRHTVVVGDTIDLGPSTTVDVLHASAGDTENENNNSVVIRVTYGDVRLLLGGDCESPVCEGAFDPGPIDVYKVHHHGSYNGSSATLLDEMQPKTALISVGADNSYGHPADQTIDRLTDVGATIWRTDLDGDIVVRSDGTTWTTNGIP